MATGESELLDGERGVGVLTQHVLLDLASGGLRQLAENHLLGHLEAGQVGTPIR